MSQPGVIEREHSQVCEKCGKSAETRPYGPNGEEVCFPCAMQDEPAAKRAFEARISGPEAAEGIERLVERAKLGT